MRRLSVTVPPDIEREVLRLIAEQGHDPDGFGVFSKALIEYIRQLRLELRLAGPSHVSARQLPIVVTDQDDFGFVKE